MEAAAAREHHEEVAKSANRTGSRAVHYGGRIPQANTVQENWKVQRKNQMKAVNPLERQVFEATTSGIDAIRGRFGKFSNEAVQLRRIRTRMLKPQPAGTT